MNEITITINKSELDDIKWALDIAAQRADSVLLETTLDDLLKKIIEAEA